MGVRGEGVGDGPRGQRGESPGSREPGNEHAAGPGPPAPPYQSERGVEERDHQVCDGQVDDEEAGGRVHSLVLEDDMTDQDVAKEREDDDEGVSHDEQGFHRGVLGLGPVAPPAHEVLPVREGVVVPEEVRGVGGRQGRRQARLVLRALGALGGVHQGEEDEQRPVPGHLAGAAAPGRCRPEAPAGLRAGRRGEGRTGPPEGGPRGL